MSRNRKNINLPDNFRTSENYVRPRLAIDSSNIPRKYPDRNRVLHTRTILEKLQGVEHEVVEFRKNLEQEGTVEGFYITFDGEPKNAEEDKEYELKVDSLEATVNYQVVAFQKLEDGTERAVVFVPENKTDSLRKKINKSIDPVKPTSIDMVDSISNLRLAELKDLWTSDLDMFPSDLDEERVWELWIFDNDRSETNLRTFCAHKNIEVIDGVTSYLDRRVIQINTTANLLSHVLHYQKIICEIRKSADTPFPIIESDIEEQHEWAGEINSRVRFNNSNTEVWIFDSGLNYSHNPLLQNLIDPSKLKSAYPEWGPQDDSRWHYHGTCMSGLAQYGDLLPLLLTGEHINLNHSVASFKILPPNGNNDPKNYPFITRRGVSESDIASPKKQKIYNMAVTDKNTSKKGAPTSWSSEIDTLSYGSDVGESGDKRLFIISAGNVQSSDYPRKYPDENILSPIQDPAQSWNALTVGAYTNLSTIDEPELNGYVTVAPPKTLSPRSTTSLTWTSLSRVPIKPDFVLEGGNCALSLDGSMFDEPASLSILTTSGRTSKVFDYSYGTSSATALAANMAAQLQSAYPEYWVETIRGLSVHSSEWSEEMHNEFRPYKRRAKTQSLLAKYGYGIPDLSRALACAENEVTVVYQGNIQPYQDGSSKPKYNECQIFDLPWPVDVLRNLGETDIKMKVTLSYFIEPNPSLRGEIGKYQFSSFGLRFTTLGSLESDDSFRYRVSESLRTGEEITRSTDDNSSWKLGPNLRTRGSIHCDIWTGKATELAGKKKIAIFPVSGWWKDYTKKKKWNTEVRYSLIVSIESPEVEAEIYNTVENIIRVSIPTEVDV